MRHLFIFVFLFSYLFATGCSTLGLDNGWVKDPKDESSYLNESDWKVRGKKKKNYSKRKVNKDESRYSYSYNEPKPSKAIVRAWTDEYLGKRGYLVRPPVFPSQSEARKFQRCKPIEIVGFEKQDKSGKYVLIAQQGSQTLRITSVDRKDLKLNHKSKMSQLDKHFVGQLHFLDQKRHRASVGQNLCVGKLWKHMPKDFFLFISGKPDEIRPGKGEYKGVEQWVYKSKKGHKEHSYYFNNGSLWAWTD